MFSVVSVCHSVKIGGPMRPIDPCDPLDPTRKPPDVSTIRRGCHVAITHDALDLTVQGPPSLSSMPRSSPSVHDPRLKPTTFLHSDHLNLAH